MKELVLFYSYSGNTKTIANRFAADNNCDICEVTDKKRYVKFAAYTTGIVKSIKGGGRKINPLMTNETAVNFEDYGIINVFSPVWADHTPPPVNSALKLIPAGAKIKLFMVSMSGKSGKDSMTKRLLGAGLEIKAYEDIKN